MIKNAEEIVTVLAVLCVAACIGAILTLAVTGRL